MKHALVLKYVGIALLVAALIIGHVIGLRRLFSHAAWPIVLGVMLLALLKHVGLFRQIYTSLKRRSR